jgi:Ca-activated chloride channel homolog
MGASPPPGRLVTPCWAAALAAVVLGGAVVAGQGDSPREPGRRFRTSVDLVTVTATVVDAEGRLVSGLGADAFEIYEDGERQQVTQFALERVPVSLCLLLDVSDSMYGRRIVEAKAAVSRFLFELLDGEDEFLLMTFNHAPTLVVPWMTDPDEARARIERVRPRGGTAIYDAVLAALPHLERRRRQRAAIVLISDGADTASDATVRDVRSALLRSDAFVYAVAIDPPDTRAINARVNPHTLRQMTDESGGRTEVVRDTSELGAATARIADDLNHQYVLGYQSARASDGRFHSVRVRVTRPDHRVRARKGYVAGGPGERDGRE